MGMEEFICKVKCHFLDVAVVEVAGVVIVVVAAVVVDVKRDEQKKTLQPLRVLHFLLFCRTTNCTHQSQGEAQAGIQCYLAGMNVEKLRVNFSFLSHIVLPC